MPYYESMFGGVITPQLSKKQANTGLTEKKFIEK